MTAKEKISSKKANVAVVGLGYVGLPLAVTVASAGFSVIGIEKSGEKLALLKKGKSYIKDVRDDEVREMIDAGRFTPSDDLSLLKECDVILVCVPTPLDAYGIPDTRFIKSATEDIAPHVRKGTLVILESTTYPGCTEELVGPMLEKNGLKAGVDFYLVFSPERIDPGNKSYPLSKIPKVVGGINEESSELAALFYGHFTPKPHVVSSLKAAEMTKLLENIFRLVNISFINELKLICDKMNIDIWEVIEAAKTKPYGFMPFYPGPGVGGHCIAEDPFYLSWKAREYGFYARFIELAGEINDLMPHAVVTKVIWTLNRQKKSVNGARILILGVAYKKDIGDMRQSPALKVMWDLLRKKADLSYHDPFVSRVQIDGKTLTSVALTERAIKGADLVLILTDHTSLDYGKLADQAKLIVDTRHAIKTKHSHVVL